LSTAPCKMDDGFKKGEAGSARTVDGSLGPQSRRHSS
jgi:hypothetical protein